MLLASLGCPDAETRRAFFFERLLPAIKDDIEPITIMDPACGSGIMLLAAAGQFPPWAFHYGLVRLYGQDIDYTCVQMCRINLRLYGLGAMLVVGDTLVEERPGTPETEDMVAREVGQLGLF